MHKFTAELLFFQPQGQPGVRSFDGVFMFISVPARVVICIGQQRNIDADTVPSR